MCSDPLGHAAILRQSLLLSRPILGILPSSSRFPRLYRRGSQLITSGARPASQDLAHIPPPVQAGTSRWNRFPRLDRRGSLRIQATLVQRHGRWTLLTVMIFDRLQQSFLHTRLN
jgi:hypothetical protein